MKRRRQLPLASAEQIVGGGYEFKAEHDLVSAGKPLPPPIELTPVGPAPTLYEFKPEHDRVACSTAANPEPTAAPPTPTRDPFTACEREIIQKLLIEELNVEELATSLNVTVDAVYGSLSRIVAKIEDKLSAHARARLSQAGQPPTSP